MSWPLRWYLFLLLDKNRDIICTLFCIGIFWKLVWSMNRIFWIIKFRILKLMLWLRCCSYVVMSNIANEVINIIINDRYIAAFRPLCRFGLARIFLRIKITFFATPFKCFWWKKWIVRWSKVWCSLKSMLKDKWLCFMSCSLRAQIIINFSDVYLAFTTFIEAIVRFSLGIILFPKF